MIHPYRLLVNIAAVFVALISTMNAQTDPFVRLPASLMPYGESAVAVFDNAQGVVTGNAIYRLTRGLGAWSPIASFQKVYSLDEFARFVYAYPINGTSGDLGVLLSNGRAYRMAWDDIDYSYSISARYVFDNSANENWIKVHFGVNVFALSTTALHVIAPGNNDDLIDSAGLNNARVNDIDVDPLTNNAYVATNAGLFVQRRDLSPFQPFAGITQSQRAVAVGDHSIIYSGGSFSQHYRIAASTPPQVTQMRYAGGETGSVHRMIVNESGNVVTIKSPGDVMHMSVGGTDSLRRVSSSLAEMFGPQITTNLFRAIGTESMLTVATVFGAFASSDNGVTWEERNRGIEPEHVYAFAPLRDGSYLFSTNTGLWRVGSSLEKVFPKVGYASSLPLFVDSTGDVITLHGASDNSENARLSSPMLIHRSTDNGITFHLDTAGAYANVRPGLFYHAPNGQSFYASYGSPQAPGALFKRDQGGSFVRITGGYQPGLNERPIGFFTSDDGQIYLSTMGAIASWFLRLDGDHFVADTAGTSGATVYSVTGNDQSLVIGTFGRGVLVRRGGMFTRTAFPAGMNDGYSAYVTKLDARGRLWAVFSDTRDISRVVDRGVYRSNDLGQSWTYLGLDTIPIERFNLPNLAIREAAFVGLPNDTMVVMTSRGPLYYNRFGDTSTSVAQDLAPIAQWRTTENEATMPIELTTRSTIVVDLFNNVGSNSAIVVNRSYDAGTHILSFATTDLPSGTYYCRTTIAGTRHYSRVAVVR